MKFEKENMLPIFYDREYLLQVPKMVYRFNAGGFRYYYTTDTGRPKFYISVTTGIKATLPTPKELIQWYAKMGIEEAEDYTEIRQDYGTFLGIETMKLLIDRKYNLDNLRAELTRYCQDRNIDIDFVDDHENELKKDMLAFAQFMIDHKVKPIGVELVLVSDVHGYGGALDLVCLMTIEEKGYWGEVYKSGERKGDNKESKREIEVLAILDLKSGRKGFYESHEIQLQAYKILFEENYPSRKVERLYNWSPKDWRTTPGYNLKDQTDGPNKEKLPYLISLFKIEQRKRGKTMTVIKGIIDVDQGLGSNYMDVPIDELVSDRWAKLA